MKMKGKYLVMSALLMCGVCTHALAQSTEMTYQGRLQNSGEPFNGNANFQFLLFDALFGGNQVGSMQNVPGLAVDDGLFQVELDFGPAAFGGGNRFLEIWVNGAPLSPRQPIHAAPVALFALDGNDGPQGPPGPEGPQGNPGPTGSQGPQGPEGQEGALPFDFYGTRGSFHYTNNDNDSTFRFQVPNFTSSEYGAGMVVGRSINSAAGHGAVVLGGGRQEGGTDYPNEANGDASAIIGGDGNEIKHVAESSAILAGVSGLMEGDRAVILGGDNNWAYGNDSATLGGFKNAAPGIGSVAIGGGDNCAGANSSFAGGHRAKVRKRNAGNPVGTGCEGVPNGQDFARGDEGTFVWNGASLDSETDFVSSGVSQFLVMASGGALISGSPAVNNPEGNRLRINGTLRVDTLGSSGLVSLCRNAAYQIATCSSSERYKEGIRDLELDSSVLMALRPVRYRWIDSQQEDIGLVAEEVAELIPELATYNEDGQVEGLKYDRLAAWLVAVVQQQESERQRIDQALSDLGEEMTETRALVEVNQTLRQQNASLEARLVVLESLLMADRELTEAK